MTLTKGPHFLPQNCRVTDIPNWVLTFFQNVDFCRLQNMSPRDSQMKGSVPEQNRVPCQWRSVTQKCVSPT